MAVLKMQKISICALKKDRKAILEQLQHLGVLEVDRDKDCLLYTSPSPRDRG